MTTQILIHPNVPDSDLILSALKEDVTSNLLSWDDISDLTPYFDQNAKRIGLMWDNVLDIRFGRQLLKVGDRKFQYFTQEMYDLLNLYAELDGPINVDLITCNLSDTRFIQEVQRFKGLLVGDIQINYSVNYTGSTIDSDWIMESNGESIKNYYFTSAIDEYRHVLGGSSGTNGFIQNGKVFMWGANLNNQMGLGPDGQRTYNEPIQIPGITTAKKVSIGIGHAAILLENGTVLTCGNNSSGNLGLGNFISVDTFQLVPNVTNVIDISCSAFSTYFLLEDRTVLACGRGNQGQLGQGIFISSSSTPIPIPGLNNVKALSGGGFFVMFLLENGKVYTTGLIRTSSSDPANLSYSPREVEGISDAIAIYAGAFHCSVVLKNGTVKTFGYGEPGNLGNGENMNSLLPVTVVGIDNAVNVCCGNAATLVLLDNGQLKCFGSGRLDGRLGTGEYIDSNVPVDVINIDYALAISASQFSFSVLQSNGRVYSFGSNGESRLGICIDTFFKDYVEIPPRGLQDIQSSNEHTLYHRFDGRLLAAGFNRNGQLGIGSFDDKAVPTFIPGLTNVIQISCGSSHSAVLLTDGTVRTFGSNDNGQLGDGTTLDRNYPVNIGVTGAIQVACLGDTTFIVKNDGTVLGCGFNSSGQLGTPPTSPASSILVPTLIPGLTNVTKIAGGVNHAIALRSDKTLLVIGNNSAGQLGIIDSPPINNTFIPLPVPGINTAIDVASGYFHNIVLLEDGTVRTFGAGNNGALGTGGLNNEGSPIDIGLTDVTEIYAGFFHTLVRLADGSARIFGANFSGQLGLNSYTTIEPTPVPVSVNSGMNIIASGNNTFIFDPVPANQARSTLATGDNFYGNLGLGFNSGSVASPTPVCGFPFASALADEARGNPDLGKTIRYWSSIINGLC